MIALTRYVLADYLRSQRFVPPLVAYLGFLAVLYAFPGTILPGFGASAAALLPVSVWIALSLHNTEDALQATVTMVNAGGRGRVMAGKTYATVVGVLVLTVTALVWPMVSSSRIFSPADLTTGLITHLTCGLTGISLGTCCARPVINRQGYAFATAFLLSIVALVNHTLTPANRTIRLLSAAPPGPSAAGLLLPMAWALLMLTALAALSSWVARRRR